MKHIIFIAIGGAGGALARYWVATLFSQLTPGHFPYGTLAVNVLGSLCIGVLYVLIAEKMTLHPDWRSVLMVGFLGAFTTFSTFSLETIALIDKGEVITAVSYAAASLLLCLLAAAAGIALARFATV